MALPERSATAAEHSTALLTVRGAPERSAVSVERSGAVAEGSGGLAERFPDPSNVSAMVAERSVEGVYRSLAPSNSSTSPRTVLTMSAIRLPW